MNERTRIQIEEMKKQTIGVEVEMYNITREKACRTIAAYYGTENTVRYIGGSYYAWACKDNQGREWKITRDSSIYADCDEEKTEMGTPILHYSDIEGLQKIIRNLRHAGAKSDPAHMCGVHIHIGLGEHSPQTLRNLANIMASHESLLISALRLDRSRINATAIRSTRISLPS
jgi:ankyrin repeat protein